MNIKNFDERWNHVDEYTVAYKSVEVRDCGTWATFLSHDLECSLPPHPTKKKEFWMFLCLHFHKAAAGGCIWGEGAGMKKHKAVQFGAFEQPSQSSSISEKLLSGFLL